MERKNVYVIGEISKQDWWDDFCNCNFVKINDLEKGIEDIGCGEKIDLIILDLQGPVNTLERNLIIKSFEREILLITFVEAQFQEDIERLKLNILSYLKPIHLPMFKGIFNTIMYCQNKKNQLIETNRYYQSYFNKSRVGMALRCMDGRLFNINEEFCNMLGYQKEELIGKTNEFYTHPDDLEKDRTMIENLKKGKLDSITKEKKYLDKNGKIIWGLLNLSIERGINNKPEYYFAQVQDITRLKLTEKQLRHSSKMEAIGTMAGGIAHDFNNILGVIFGFSELVLDELKEDSQSIRYIKKIIDSADKAKDLISQILRFSRGVETKKSAIRIEPILKEFLKLLRAITPSNIFITNNNQSKSELVIADPMQFQQVLMHICVNANEAMMEDGGQINVDLKDVEIKSTDLGMRHDLKPGSYLLISISDTGKGMEKEVLERIFDPYYSTNNKAGFTGLSLAITYQIVREFGGSIQVNSTPGKGTTFEIYLQQREILKKGREYQNKADLPGTERILFVDDEKNLVEIGDKILGKAGYQVTAVASSIRALNLFKENPDKFDLIISDMTMPEMTGLQLSRKLLKIKPEIPIIICTGFSKMINEENFKALGISGMLFKPITKEKLFEKIRKIFD